jgi:hypothetical protein
MNLLGKFSRLVHEDLLKPKFDLGAISVSSKVSQAKLS